MNESINDTLLHTPERRRTNTYIILALLCVLSVCLNSLVTYCLVSNRKKTWARKAKQLFYLVLSDFFSGICLIPRTIFATLDISLKTYEVCAVLNYIVFTPQVISFYHVLSLCIHRFMQIRTVHLPSLADKYRYGLESCVIWIASVLVCTPPFFFWGQHDEVLTNCSFISIFGASDKPAMIYILVLLCIPWILINATYVAIVRKMMSSGRVNPATSLQSDNICQQFRENVATSKQEQPCPKQTNTTPLLATRDQNNIGQDASASSQRCTIVNKSAPRHSDVVATDSRIQEEPRTHERTTTRQNNIHHDAVVQFSASSQRCNIQQSSSHQSVANASDAKMQEEHQQPKNPIHQNTATPGVVTSTAARQTQPAKIVQERNKRVVKGITLLLLAFNISIFPLVLIPCMMLYGNDDIIPPQIQGFVFLNNVLNPIIYTFTFTQLREEVKRTLRLAFSRLRNMTA